MSRPDGGLVDIEGYYHFETADAYCMSIDVDEFGKDAERHWLPKSKTEYSPIAKPNLAIFTMPEWLATEKGLV